MKKQSLIFDTFATAQEVEERLRKAFGSNPNIEGLDAIEDNSGQDEHEVRFYTSDELRSADRGHLIYITQPDSCAFNTDIDIED